jgi:cytochrome c biogenesis protein CcmG/thiol:disulfide interchange protein DsbE
VRGRGVRIAALVVIAVSVGLALVFSSRFGSDPDLVASPLVGQPAPSIQLQSLDRDETIALADLRGDIVVINFFASWCLECRKEHADLVATAEAFAGQGVQFMQISFDDEPAASRGFLDELGRSEHTLYASDLDGRAAIGFGVFGVPETYFLDPDGVVVGKIQGESNALLLGQTIDRIKAGERPGQQVVGDVQSSPDD